MEPQTPADVMEASIVIHEQVDGLVGATKEFIDNLYNDGGKDYPEAWRGFNGKLDEFTEHMEELFMNMYKRTKAAAMPQAFFDGKLVGYKTGWNDGFDAGLEKGTGDF